MPSLPYNFSGVANSQGQMTVTRSIPVGALRIRITKFTLRTHSGCNGRTHQLKVHINEDAIFNGPMPDCANLTLHSDRSWRGVLQLSFVATGFKPGEKINGSGNVEFVFALL